MAFGSPKATHTAAGKQAVAKIEREAETVVQQAKAGKCTQAYLAYAEMKRAEGAAEAHMRAGGQVYLPLTSLTAAGGAFSDHCVRLNGVKYALDGGPDTTKPPPKYHDRKGPPPGVPILPGMKGSRRRRR
jgi:hypothetical protein